MLVNAGVIRYAILLAANDWVGHDVPILAGDAQVFSCRVVGAALHVHSRWLAVGRVIQGYQLFLFLLRDVIIASRSSIYFFLYPFAHSSVCFGLHAIFSSPIPPGTSISVDAKDAFSMGIYGCFVPEIFHLISFCEFGPAQWDDAKNLKCYFLIICSFDPGRWKPSYYMTANSRLPPM